MDEGDRVDQFGGSSWESRPAPLGTRPRIHQTRPGLIEAILLLLVMGMATLVAMTAVMAGRRSYDLDMMLMGILEVSAIALVLLIGVRRTGVPAGRIFALRGVSPTALLAMVPLALAMGIVSTALDAPIRSVVPVPNDLLLKMAEVLYPETTLDWYRILIPAAVLVPLGEELLFRGLLLRGFLLRYGAMPALALSSLLFAVIHFNPWGMVGYFTVGWLLGWLVLCTGSLWPSILMHGLYNTFAIVQLKTSLDGPPTVEALEAITRSWWESPLSVIVATVALVALIMLFQRTQHAGHPWLNEEEIYGGRIGSKDLA